ncbi:MAG: SPOR domain-containing protein [Thiobacillus sp.]|nr:SPOR domain-containing protein [Thiobacillus sp.]
MPPPSTENDLKRRARRRLIGAVALTLLAVIVLPLLLEDEPPPASSLAVKMAATSASDAGDDAALSGETKPLEAPIVADATRLADSQPDVTAAAPVVPTPVNPASSAEPSTPAPAKSSPPAPKPAKLATRPIAKPAETLAPQAKPVADSESYVVQLAALSDATKANALKARAGKSGLPAYTDKVGMLTRVRVGPFATREEAVEASVKLAEKGMVGQVLAR